ncbi:MAG: hypothetical protein RR588_11945 [Solibacillus sp.]
MNSQQHLQAISQLVHQLKEELQVYEDAVIAEAKELQFCDEYQQDLLHIIESFATSGSESASIISKLRQNRVKRRDIKDNQKIKQKLEAPLKQLKQAVHAFPTTNGDNTPTYILKTAEGLQLVDTLDAERKRTKVTFKYIERTDKVEPPETTKPKIGISPKCTDIIRSSPTDTSVHLLRSKKGWQLIENDETILFANNKMQKVASFIISENLKVYADKLAINQLTKLVKEQLQLH